jgi:Holliday junction DNA helicase RuvA
MIGSLRGLVLDRSARGEVLLEVGGVGYRVNVSATTVAELGPVGTSCFVHVHTHVREDAIVLYGFATSEERDCFEALIAAHGVGPAVALAVLSTHSPAALRRAIAEEDVDALVLVPGIGRKTATRLLIELKGRLDSSEAFAGGSLSSACRPAGHTRAEVQAALAGLGYNAEEVREALRGLEDQPAAEMLRSALRQMAGVR